MRLRMNGAPGVKIGPDFSPGNMALMGMGFSPWDKPYMVGGASMRCAYGVDEETQGQESSRFFAGLLRM